MFSILIVIYLISPGGYATTVSVHTQEIQGFSSLSACEEQKPGFVKDFEGSIHIQGGESKVKPVFSVVKAKCFSKK